MNTEHPNSDHLLAFVEGDAECADPAAIRTHLATCPSCTARAQGWSRTRERLQKMGLPDRSQKRPRARSGGRPRVAAVAALILSAGFCLGRIWRPANPDTATLRAEIRAQLQAEGLSLDAARKAFANDVRAAVSEHPTSNPLQEALRNAMDRTAAQATVDSLREARTQTEILAASMQNARFGDRQAEVGRLEEFRRSVDERFLNMRTDLELLATTADDKLRRANTEISQLAARRAGKP
jgi:type II secretory pathway component PulM